MTLKKILKEDFEDIHNEPIENYYAGIKSEDNGSSIGRWLNADCMESSKKADEKLKTLYN